MLMKGIALSMKDFLQNVHNFFLRNIHKTFFETCRSPIDRTKLRFSAGRFRTAGTQYFNIVPNGTAKLRICSAKQRNSKNPHCSRQMSRSGISAQTDFCRSQTTQHLFLRTDLNLCIFHASQNLHFTSEKILIKF